MRSKVFPILAFLLISISLLTARVASAENNNSPDLVHPGAQPSLSHPSKVDPHALQDNQSDVLLEGETGPDMGVWIWTAGDSARPGGVYAYGIWYENSGDTPAENVTISGTLPTDTTYAGDTGGFSPDEIDITAGTVTWSVGTVQPGESGSFWVTLNVDSAHPSGAQVLGDYCLSISTTTTPGDGNNTNDNSCSGAVDVEEDEVEVGIEVWHNPGDPAPGEEFDYVLHVCNYRRAAAGPLNLYEYLPEGVSLLGWRVQNEWEPLWNEVSAADDQLVLMAPGFPGYFCQQIFVRAQVSLDLPVGTQLINQALLSAEDDVFFENNQFIEKGTQVGSPRLALDFNKRFVNGSLTPGGWMWYGIDIWNTGNTPTQGWLTVNLPAGTSYQENSGVRDGWIPFEPTITGNQLVWDLDVIGVGKELHFDYGLDITTASPGSEVENCAVLSLSPTGPGPSDKSICISQTIYDSGPNLRISKEHSWSGDDRINYTIRFENIGDELVDEVWITDTLPASTSWADKWDLSFDPDRLVAVDFGSGEAHWNLVNLYPGDMGEIHFDLSLDDPSARNREYTNTVEINVPDDDPSPDDNRFVDTAYSKGEVEWIELDRIGDGHVHVFGQAIPDRLLTLVTAENTFTTTVDGGGYWDIPDAGQVLPGDEIIVELDGGSAPVTFNVPEPFVAQADSAADMVTGQVGGGGAYWVEIHGSWPGGYQETRTDEAGNFAAYFSDIPRGGRGQIRYVTSVEYTKVAFSRNFFTGDLVLEVNYAHDWVQSMFEAGHTVWLTVTESDGVTLKDEIQLTTGPIQIGEWDVGFATWTQGGWLDLQPGDWIYARTDTGQTAEVHIGEITATADADTDTVTGTVEAEWLSYPLAGACEVWEPNGPPWLNFTTGPDGSFACDYSKVGWDLLPGHDVAVRYYEPDGDQVINVVEPPAPHLRINNWGEGMPGEGGNYAIHVQYDNGGTGPAENVVITQTVSGLSYISDYAPVDVVTGTLPGGELTLRWDLGTLPPQSSADFYVFFEVEALAGETISSLAEISTTDPYDQGDPSEKESYWEHPVQENDTRLNLGMYPWTDNPAPGESFIWVINVCNNGSTGSSQITLTDYLPDNVSLIRWWGQHGGLTQVSLDTEKLVLTHPTLPSGYCSEVYLDFYVDETVPVGTMLYNAAEIYAENDIDDGNQVEQWLMVGDPFKGIRVDMGWDWGVLVPGGELHYFVLVHNNGNTFIDDDFDLTFSLPENTTFLGSYRNGNPFPPDDISDGTLLWKYSDMRNGFSQRIDIVLKASPHALPGTVLRTRAEVTKLEGEFTWDDNTSEWEETLNGPGPNVRVRKTADWHGVGEGHNAWYQIIVENVGDTEVEHIWLHDEYPPEMQLAGGPWFDWNQAESYVQEDDKHRFAIQFQRMNPGFRQDINFDTIIPGDDPVPFGLTLTNTVYILPPEGDSNPADDQDTAILKTGPDLYVEQSLVDGELLPGEVITLSLKFGNDQPPYTYWWNMEGMLLIEDVMPAGFEYVESYLVECGMGHPCSLPATQIGDHLSWKFAPFHSGEWNEIFVVMRIPDNTAGVSQFTNSAEVSSDRPQADVEADYENNRSDYVIDVSLPAFEVSKQFTGNRVAGTEITYTLSVANTGASQGTSVTLIDHLSSLLTYQGGGDAYDEEDAEVRWTIPVIGPGQTAERSFTGLLGCKAGETVVNDEYRVSSSDQGVTSPDGPPVSFKIVAPTILAGITAPDTTLVGDTIQFLSSSTTNGTALTYSWNFGDGSTAVGEVVSHQFAEPGDYEVTLTATDACGYADTQTISVHVLVVDYQLFLPLAMR